MLAFSSGQGASFLCLWWKEKLRAELHGTHKCFGPVQFPSLPLQQQHQGCEAKARGRAYSNVMGDAIHHGWCHRDGLRRA